MKRRSISYAIELVLSEFFLVQKNIDNISGLYKTVMQEVESTLIKKIMKLTDKNKTQTAKILGITRNTLVSKLKSLGLKDENL